MTGDESAWKEMEKYNKQDVALLEEVYDIMLPWITHHPNLALYLDEDRPVCTNCGSKKVWKNKDKFPLNSQAYTLYQCQDCGTWIRSRYTTTPKEQRKNILTQVK
jgi:DNA-directed RNA polymerase subunit RPC12/RpoP